MYQCVVAATLLVAPSALSAQTTAYSTFLPGDTYGPGGIVRQDLWLASRFIYSGASSAPLQTVRVAAAGNPPGSQLDIYFLSGGYFWDPGDASLLEQWSVTSSASGIYQFHSTTNPVLTPGMHYWLALGTNVPLNNQNYWTWFSGAFPLDLSTNLQGQAVSFDQGLNWLWFDAGGTGAFDVTVGPDTSVVPEPATMTLLATGLAGIAAVRRKRRERPSA